MKPKYLITGFALILAIAAVIFVSSWVTNQERLNLSLKWSGLESYPNEIQNLEIKPEGSYFSREFRVTFDVPVEELDRWITENSKIKSTEPELTDDGLEKYLLEPEGGAKVAELFVNRESGQVELYVLWS